MYIREGGPVVHEQLRQIVAPQHIEKDYLDTRYSNRGVTHRAPLSVGISTNYLESNLTCPYMGK